MVNLVLMNTKQIRAAIKAINAEATVSADRGWDDAWTVRVENAGAVEPIRERLASMGLNVSKPDVQGSRWNWVYALDVTSPESVFKGTGK